MPLPDPSPALVQAPARAGVGLRFHIYDRLPAPSWPEDWWQRNYDELLVPDDPGPMPLTERMMHLPPPPEPAP